MSACRSYKPVKPCGIGPPNVTRVRLAMRTGRMTVTRSAGLLQEPRRDLWLKTTRKQTPNVSRVDGSVLILLGQLTPMDWMPAKPAPDPPTPHANTGHKPGGRRQPPAGYLGKVPRESDMSMNDVAIIAGAIVVLALIGFVFYKRVIKN